LHTAETAYLQPSLARALAPALALAHSHARSGARPSRSHLRAATVPTAAPRLRRDRSHICAGTGSAPRGRSGAAAYAIASADPCSSTCPRGRRTHRRVGARAERSTQTQSACSAALGGRGGLKLTCCSASASGMSSMRVLFASQNVSTCAARRPALGRSAAQPRGHRSMRDGSGGADAYPSERSTRQRQRQRVRGGAGRRARSPRWRLRRSLDSCGRAGPSEPIRGLARPSQRARRSCAARAACACACATAYSSRSRPGGNFRTHFSNERMAAMRSYYQ
jgi:hypothetical protein